MTKKEAIKVIDGRFDIMDYCESARLEEALDLAIKALEQPERKNGKWIGKEQFTNSPEFYSWQCSVCGCVLEDPALDKPYPFCPNCGSFNGGEQE